MPESFLTLPIRSDKMTVTLKVERSVCSVQTPYQQVDIVDTVVFGRALFLDGHIQLTEFDERAYHECLVQVPLLNMESPRAALVIGGGDGGVIREIARHPSIERIAMVEIDQGVVDACREHMPFLSDGAFDDPRLDLRIMDAFEFAKHDAAAYDLIVVDSTDRYEDAEENLSENLFTEAFYRDCLRLLSPNGFVVSQADNHVICAEMTHAALEEFAAVFPATGSYQGLVPSFGGYSGFIWGSKGPRLGPPSAAKCQALGTVYLNQATSDLAFSPVRFR